jgi:Ca-activated chloride channel family protein
MQRWHLTFGLATVAAVGAWLAPRLGAVAPTVHPLRPPDVTPAPPSTGHLVLDAGLDRWAVPSDTSAERYLTITVRAPDDLGVSERRPVDLSVVLDASGSMSEAGKIDNARTAAKVLASSMEATDTWSLVTFSDVAAVVVPAARLDGVTGIHDKIDRVREGGGTNLFAGLEAGAREVERSLRAAHAEDGRRPVGRVVLLSDGIANVGVVDDETLSRFASTLASSGITVSTVGLGLDYNEDLLARLADVGGGSYAFVDDAGDLEAAFADELERSSAVVARDTRVRITVPEGARLVELVGWEATAVPGGWDVFLGDVPAGATRKIVARMVVEPRPVGALPVATVTAEWLDLVDEARASAEARVTAVVTEDAAVVDASLDRDKAIEATRARGSWYLDRSTRAFVTGDAALSKKLLDEGQALYQSAASSLGDHFAPMTAAMQDAAGDYEENLPESEEGRRAVKENKEKVREFSR